MTETATERKPAKDDAPVTPERRTETQPAGGAEISGRPEVDLSNPANRVADRAEVPGPATRSAAVQGDQLVIPPVFNAEATSLPGGDRTARPGGDTVRPGTDTAARPAAMSQETLDAAARALKSNLGDRNASEAILRAIPAGDKERFQQTWSDQNQGKPLRDELTRRGIDASLLDPKEEVRNAAWLQRNLDSLDRRFRPDPTTRTLVEHNIRTNLQTMTEAERKALDTELAGRGTSLKEVINKANLSGATKEIAGIYADKAGNLSDDDRKRVAEIGLNAFGTREQKLMIVKEAFAGPAGENARTQFMNEGGEEKLKKTFSGTDLQQAMDYAKLGKLHTATLIDLQHSHVANNDRGIDVALDLMTKEDRQRFSEGERLAKAGKTEGATDKEREALDYYNRVHTSLQNAAFVASNPSSWFSNPRDAKVAQWEDRAANGHETLLSRVAKADDVESMRAAIRGSGPEDQKLMQDPTYREKVFGLLGGQNPSQDDSRLLNPTARAGREELVRTFGDGAQRPPEANAGHATLKEVTGRNFDRFQGPKIYDALMNGKAAEFNTLSDGEKRALEARLRVLPEDTRKSAEAMLKTLQSGQDVTPGLAQQLHMDGLKGATKQAVLERLLAAKPEERTGPGVLDAARTALGGQDQFDKLAKPIIEGKPLTAENLLAANFTPNSIFSGGTLDHQSYYNGLKLLPKEQRDQLVADADKEKTDPEAKKRLDTAFGAMSEDERKIALSVLKNPNAEFTMADQVRSMNIGGNVDQKALVQRFSQLSRDEKMTAIQDYARNYNQFLPTDLAKNADEPLKKQIDLSMPMDVKDLQRAFADKTLQSGHGLYGHVATTETSLFATQNVLQTQLLDKLPADQREQARKDIEESFQKYVKALRTNDEAKDKYADDLKDKIMLVASVPLGAAAGANMVRLALAAATSVATRVATDGVVKGTITSGDVTSGAVLGAVDGLSFGRASTFGGAFAKALEKTGLSKTAQTGLTHELETMAAANAGNLSREQIEQTTRQHLERAGVTNAGERSRQVLDDAVARSRKPLGIEDSIQKGTDHFRTVFSQKGAELSQHAGLNTELRAQSQALSQVDDLFKQGKHAEALEAYKQMSGAVNEQFLKGLSDFSKPANVERFGALIASKQEDIRVTQKVLGQLGSNEDVAPAELAKALKHIELTNARNPQLGLTDTIAQTRAAADQLKPKLSDEQRQFASIVGNIAAGDGSVEQIKHNIRFSSLEGEQRIPSGQRQTYERLEKNLNLLPEDKRAATLEAIASLRKELNQGWRPTVNIGEGTLLTPRITSQEGAVKALDGLATHFKTPEDFARFKTEAERFLTDSAKGYPQRTTERAYELQIVKRPDGHIEMIRFENGNVPGRMKAYIMEVDQSGRRTTSEDFHALWDTNRNTGKFELVNLKLGTDVGNNSNYLYDIDKGHGINAALLANSRLRDREAIVEYYKRLVPGVQMP